MPRTLLCCVFVAVLALGSGACSSNDADDPSATTESTETLVDTTAGTDTTDTTSGDEGAAFCATNDEIDALFDHAEEPQAMIDASNEALALTPDLLASAPEELTADVEVIVAATEAVAAGDPAGFATQEFQDATAEVTRFCGA